MAFGHLIVIEGGDGTGKQTQSERLYRHLIVHASATKTPPPILYSFPQYHTPTGKAIRAMLAGTIQLSLSEKIRLYAEDRKAAQNTMLSHLAHGSPVICDRYITSMLVYASAYSIPTNAKNNVKPLSTTERRDLCFEIANLELKKNQMPVADLQLFLSLDPEISRRLRAERGHTDINEADQALQWDVYRIYRQLNDINTFGVARKHREIDCNDSASSISDADTIHTRVVETVRTELGLG